MNQSGFVKNAALFQETIKPVATLPPSWAAQSIFYQIFPERFCNGDLSNDPVEKEAWDAQPTCFNFFGGDLKGIIDKIPYLKQLGVTSLYLNPVFESPSNHKYNTSDFLKIDPSFGDIWTFKKLIQELHNAGMKLIIDGVFNHTGDTFKAFQDVLKRGADSRFKDWYYFHGFPVVQGSNPNYDCWWNFGTLPKLNYQNPEVVRYILRVVAFWTSLGIDGWRLDVPNEVVFDFWKIFRRLVKSINPEAFIVGEIWDDPAGWLRGDTCDAVMNYQWRDAVLRYFAYGQSSADQLRVELAGLRANLPWETITSAYNLLSSHDTPRFLTLCGGERRKFLAALAFQFTYPGIPALYYGDEIGLQGDKDPDCRKTMQWDPQNQNQVILEATQTLAALRRQYQALQDGGYYELNVGEALFGFVRCGQKEQILFVSNMSPECRLIQLPEE
ncbi:MAG TPA: glycoside hydrolase family 13 protein, partial [Bacillota bacterium]|nr:glycoside hydrolase family 13 protein [Bacillota bacterium]